MKSGRPIKTEIFKTILRASKQATNTSNCRPCLHLKRQCLVLVIGVLFAGNLTVCSAAQNIIRVREKEPLTLNCTNRTLSGQILYKWSRQDGGDIAGPTNTSSLEFTSTTRNRSGIYYCNIYGILSFNESIQLIVEYLPRVVRVETSRDPTLKPGDSIELSCIIDAVPPSNKIIWTKDFKMIKVNSNISISSVTCSDAGEYQCFPFNNIGSSSKNGSVKLRVEEPSKPISIFANQSKDCQSLASVYVQWSQPLQVNGPLEDISYQVYYQRIDQNTSLWQPTNTTLMTNYTINGLEYSKSYYIKVQACNLKASCCSKYSNSTKVEISRDNICNTYTSQGSDSESLSAAYIVLIVIIILIIILIVLVIFILRCRNRSSQLCCKMPFRGLMTLEPTSNPNVSRGSSFKERREREAIPYERFWNHVTLRHADTNYRFSSEFESLQGIIEKSKKLSWNHSQRPENQSKNRFANVVAYDQTRVVLSMVDNEQGSHYINANYVDSNNSMNFYIATQGPLANTIGDFWRMVWEQNSRVIVMITNIIEKGRHKCAQYWPTKNKKEQDCGKLRVTFLKEEHFAFYTHREFEVKPLKDSTHYVQDATDEAVKPIIVQQYHFTGWPDHGVPDPGYEIPVLDFIFKSTAAQVAGAGPLIVHCSAGVGRSGAYIVIDSMVKRIHDTGDVDIFNFLCQIRHQRNYLVQEECQYIFVHDVILEYIQCNFLLSLPKKALHDHVSKLRSTMHSSGKNKISAEYERLKSIKIQEYNLKESQRKCNVNKNRTNNIFPVDCCRVKLYPRPGEEGSDYINASYIDGFWRREAYIATQHPLDSTTFDFWRMIWQENCRSLVMLISQEELEQSDVYPRYLPVVHDTARFGVYEVTMETETARGDLMIRDLRMISLNEPGEIRKIRHFHFLHWPAESQPWSGQSLLQLISKVDDWERDVKSKSKPFDMIGPIVVHCSSGAGRTGIYCLLHTLWHQVVRDEVASIYAYSRLYFHQRLDFLLTQDQYEYVYDTMVEYIEADCSLYLV